MANWATTAALGDSSSPEWQEQNLTWIEPIEGQRWQVYKPAAAQFEGLIKDLLASGYKPTSSGGYNYRNIRGGNSLSQHAFGTAIDMNALTNALGMSMGDIPNASALAKKWGLEWGGDWKGRKDPMHFEYKGGTAEGPAAAGAFDAKQQWVAQMWPYAVAQSQKTGIDPRVIMSQAALETGWGKSAPNNNYFGIKGKGSTQSTLEMIDGKMVPVKADFRAYQSPEEAFTDYGGVMMGGRYAPVREAKGLEAQLAALQASGYASDSKYAQKLLAIANQIPVDGYASAAGGGHVSHPPNPQVGTGGYVAPGAPTTQPGAAPPPAGGKDKYGKAIGSALGSMAGAGAPVLGEGGNAPQVQVYAPPPASSMAIVAEDGGADYRNSLALLMQRLNSGRLA